MRALKLSTSWKRAWEDTMARTPAAKRVRSRRRRGVVPGFDRWPGEIVNDQGGADWAATPGASALRTSRALPERRAKPLEPPAGAGS